MTDSGVVNPGRSRLYIQQGGSGRRWEQTDAETDVDAPSGGDRSFATEWSFGQFKRRRTTGNPSDRSFNISSRSRYGKSGLRNLARRSVQFGETFNAMVGYEQANYGGSIDIPSFKLARLFVACSAPLAGGDKPILNDTAGDQSSPMDTFSITAGTEIELRQLAHNRSGVTTVNGGINDVIFISESYNEALMVGGAVTPATLPRLYYYKLEDDGTITFKTLLLTAITDATAVSVALVGDRILIGCTGTTAGIWSVSLKTAKATASGSTVAAALVSGIASGVVINAVKLVGKYVFAAGVTGLTYISRDLGFSFAVLGTVTGTPTVNCISGVSDKDVWFGCNAGAIANWYLESSFTTFTPSVISGDNVTSIAVPPREASDDIVRRWVYLGSNTGEIWSTSDAGSTGSTFTQRRFDGDNTGTITDLEFVGAMGAVLGIIQTTAAPISRVLVDYSGGFCAAFVREVSVYTFVTNTGFKALAWLPNDPNTCLVVGNTISSLGFVGEMFG